MAEAEATGPPPTELPPTDTIVAISTAGGVGAIGIVRLSGSRSVEYAGQVFRAATRPVGDIPSHQLVYGHAVAPDTGAVLDEVLLAVMRAPATYTREDVVEVHCHGGVAAQRAVLRAFVGLGARPAEAGEFTRRAFMHGRLDLTQAESVAAIVGACSAGALRAAVHQLEGGLAGQLRSVRSRLVAGLAQVEAGIDFSDEDVDDLDRVALDRELADAQARLERLLATAFLGRALEQGVRTAIVGRPNVGKSSLLNALLMRERAIVSEIPGTTRDTIEELVEVGGVPLHLIDTAGLRDDAGTVERLGIERSHQALASADLVLVVVDLTADLDDAALASPIELDHGRALYVGNKSDLSPDSADRFAAWVAIAAPAATACIVSARTGDGLDVLRELIAEAILGPHGLQLDEPLLANERQRALVEEAWRAISAARAGLVLPPCGSTPSENEGLLPEELIAEELRRAIGALGRVTGEELVPDLLDEVFRRFCIGK